MVAAVGSVTSRHRPFSTNQFFLSNFDSLPVLLLRLALWRYETRIGEDHTASEKHVET